MITVHVYDVIDYSTIFPLCRRKTVCIASLLTKCVCMFDLRWALEVFLIFFFLIFCFMKILFSNEILMLPL